MRSFKKFYCEFLFWLCWLIDCIPVWRNGRVETSQWGCTPLGISRIAVNLEMKWDILDNWTTLPRPGECDD